MCGSRRLLSLPAGMLMLTCTLLSLPLHAQGLRPDRPLRDEARSLRDVDAPPADDANGLRRPATRPRVSQANLSPVMAPRSKPSSRVNRASYELGAMHHADEVIVEEASHGTVMEQFEQSCGAACGDSCGDSCGPDCDSCGDDFQTFGCPSCFSLLLKRTEVFSGVQSFAGPANRGGTASVGTHLGVNLGTPFLRGWRGLGLQVGASTTRSNFHGANFTTDNRSQSFLTLGLFRRVDWGLQGGLVVDYLHDEWNYSADLSQLRGELSWMMPEATEIGFWFTAGSGDDVGPSVVSTNGGAPVTLTETWDVNNLSALFVRKTFCNGAQARVFAGFSGDSDGLIGGDVTLPLCENWSFRGNMTYLIPEESAVDGGFANETWNIGLTLVWYPGCTNTGERDYYRPLFNVADNGNFMVDRQ